MWVSFLLTITQAILAILFASEFKTLHLHDMAIAFEELLAEHPRKAKGPIA